MAAAPRTSYLSGTPSWDDASLFDGFILIGLNSGQDQPHCFLDNVDFVQRLPQYVKVRVTAGVIDPTQRLYWTADIQPPNSRYWAWWYDLTGTLIYPTAGDPTAFTVTADPHPITIPTLTAPSTPASPPTTLSTSLISSTSVTFVDAATPIGTINSTDGTDGNGVFTLTSTPNPASSLMLILNGQVLENTVAYNLSGATITFVSGYYPTTNSVLRAFYRRSA